MSVKDTLQDIHKIALASLEADPNDADLLQDMLDAETDMDGLLNWCDKKMREELRIVNGLKPERDDLSARIKRAETREERLRDLVMTILNAGQITKRKLDRVTFSIKTNKPKRIVLDADKLPDKFMVISKKPDMAKIKAAETMPEGVTMNNGSKSTMVRRK